MSTNLSTNGRFSWYDETLAEANSDIYAAYALWMIIFKICHKIIFFVSGTACFTLLALILLRSTKALKNYRPMLLVSCFCDIWCWFSTFMIQLDCNIKDKVLLLHVNGNVKVFNYDTQALWISLYAVGVGTAVAILPANYYYRYRCIKEGPPRLLTMIFLYALALSMGFTYGLLCYFTMELSGNARPGFNYATLWWDAQNAPILLPGDIRSLVTKLCLGFTSIGFGTLYFIAMLLSRRTLHYFASNITLFSKGTVLIQRQLTSALMLQALVPIVTSVGPCAFLSWCAFFDMDAGVGGMLIYLFLACLPIFSPLATIFTIKPYRTAVVGVFITNETSTHYSERS